MRTLITTACLSLIASILSTTVSAGTIKGKVVFKGDVPKPELERKKGAQIKDSEVCAARNMFENDLVIHSQTRGIANVFISIKEVPEDAVFAPPKQQRLFLEVRDCRFHPHAMLVRTGQVVQMFSGDNCPHNFHTFPIRNRPVNFIVPANTPKQRGPLMALNRPEPLPVKIKCDLHPWMDAWLFVVDHPYAAVTDEKGEFEIGELPDGEHTFRVWHERRGYLEKELVIEVDGEETVVEPLEYTIEDFQEK